MVESYDKLQGLEQAVENHSSNNLPKRGTVTISSSDMESALANGRDDSTRRSLEELAHKSTPEYKAGRDFDMDFSQKVSDSVPR